MILVPYNFNETGENALKYAIQFSKVFELDIVCFHATDSEDSSPLEIDKKKTRLETEVGKINTDVKVKVHSQVVAGIFEEQIENFANKNLVDIIIVGTRKTNEAGKSFIQKRTSRFLNGVTLPILIIPPQYKFAPIKNILWASDFQPIPNDDALDPVVTLAKYYDAEVRIAHVKTSDKSGDVFQHQEMSRQDFLFSDGIKHSFKHIRRSTVSKGLSHYLNLKGDNDILVLLKREHGFLDSLFGKDTSMEFSIDPKLPILILHENASKMAVKRKNSEEK